MQSTFSFRLDDETKRSMEKLCESMGLSMSTAFNIFAKAFVHAGGFPFDIRCSQDESTDSFLEARRILRERYPEEPSLDEINAEIKRIRGKKMDE